MIDMDLVDKYYEMNPAEDFFCPYAEALQEGWRVLTESPNGKQDLANVESWGPTQTQNALRRNQWGKVLCITIDNNNAYVSLAYDDGITRQMVVNRHTAWLVKKDSVEYSTQGRPLGEVIGIETPERTYLDDRAEGHAEAAKKTDELMETLRTTMSEL